MYGKKPVYCNCTKLKKSARDAYKKFWRKQSAYWKFEAQHISKQKNSTKLVTSSCQFFI